MRRNRKTTKYYTLLIVMILFLGLGYAFLTTELSISGVAIIKSNIWDIYFENIQVKTGSVEKGTSEITNPTRVEYIAEFENVGDYYEFDVDVVNKGTIDAMVDEVIVPYISSSLSKYLDYKVTYTNGVEIEKYDLLPKTTGKHTIKVKVVYKTEVEPADISLLEEPVELFLDIKYVQATDKAKEPGEAPVDPGDDDVVTTQPTTKPTNPDPSEPEEDVEVNLYNLIKSKASNQTINFSVNSKTSGTHGIYTTTETEGNVPVYYYRGSADRVNNNIIFNNMCWKIIRTTETGGVKIIYNGAPTDGTCVATGANTITRTLEFNTNYDDNAYVGYMYGTVPSTTYASAHKNTTNSRIKTYIDNWYNAAMSTASRAKLEDAVFCNNRDTTGATENNVSNTALEVTFGTLGYARNLTLYAVMARADYETIVPRPSLACLNTRVTNQNRDKFTVGTTNGNGALTYPVGLITLDEAVLAGFNTRSSNESNYIDTTNYLSSGVTYWTMTPRRTTTNGNAVVGAILADGYLKGGTVHDSDYGVRPVVSLDSSVMVKGKGTSTNPYNVMYS